MASTGLSVSSTVRVTAVRVTARRDSAGARRGSSAPSVSSVVPPVGSASTAPRRAAAVALPPSSVAPSLESVCARPGSQEMHASTVSKPRFI